MIVTVIKDNLGSIEGVSFMFVNTLKRLQKTRNQCRVKYKSKERRNIRTCLDFTILHYGNFVRTTEKIS